MAKCDVFSFPNLYSDYKVGQTLSYNHLSIFKKLKQSSMVGFKVLATLASGSKVWQCWPIVGSFANFQMAC